MGTLRLEQLARLFYFIESICEQGSKGKIVTDDIGIGKIYQALGLHAIRCLLLQCKYHVQQNPELHNEPGQSSPCPSRNIFGIQCVCVAESLASKYVPMVQLDGVTLVTIEPKYKERWIRHAVSYFNPRVSGAALPLTSVLSCEGGQIHFNMKQATQQRRSRRNNSTTYESLEILKEFIRT